MSCDKRRRLEEGRRRLSVSLDGTVYKTKPDEGTILALIRLKSGTPTRWSSGPGRAVQRDLHFTPQLLQETLHEPRSLDSHRVRRCCVHAVLESQQFAIKVIDSPLLVIWRSVGAERIGWIIKRSTHLLTGRKTPSNANSANGVQPVRVLNKFSFKRIRDDPLGERVFANTRCNERDVRLWKSVLSQDSLCKVRANVT